MFLAQVATCYSKELVGYPQKIIDVLEKFSSVMDPDIRLTMCRALILMRNKNLLEPTALLSLFFKMLHCQDKNLRKFLETHLITDIKNLNSKHKNVKVNTVLQNFMFTMVKDSNLKASKMSLNIMIELYRKNVWNDAKTVNVIASACFSKITKVMVTALQFFLNSESSGNKSDDSDSDDDVPTTKEVMMANRVNKKTRKRGKNLAKVKTMIKKKKKKGEAPAFNFSALHLIHDPQGLAEKLFKLVESMNERFEVKLMTLDLISRLIGVHQLLLLNFYPFLQRFLQPHQREVTRILQFAAQASHELVPPDAIEGVINCLVNNFITERNSGEVMAVGMNTVREICSRCPLVMSRDLLLDLTQYKKYKDKSVMMAARSLIHLFRDVNPEMLHKKDKGKPTLATVEKHFKQYGELASKDYIPGTEALLRKDDDIEPDNDGWEEDGEDNDDSSDGEWVDVDQSDDDDGKSDIEDDKTIEDENNTDAPPPDPLEQRKQALEIAMTRVLTDEDFRKMETLQMQKEIVGAKKGSAKKRKATDSLATVTAAQVGELVELGAIENVFKKRKHDRSTRMEAVMKGREDREKFGRKKGRMNPHASTTDKEKKKKKNFMMVRHKLKKTKKRSFKEQQAALRKSLIKQKKLIK
ncbi:unnamed protein product [Allacma fusca]|uniref:Protein SDA1 n=1 Tax=Allacma fusca TaxID=39272 RepID=A0A8J2PRN9_9HEXA|nr:unnamed protein product [Allacma fusca]